MKYKKPTYEEYCKASNFAKFRYRFGVYIQLVAFLFLIFLIFYTINNIEEMKANPIDYAESKLGVVCNYPFNLQIKEITYNGSSGNITNIGEW